MRVGSSPPSICCPCTAPMFDAWRSQFIITCVWLLVMYTAYLLLCLQPIYCYVYSLCRVMFTVYFLLCLQPISCYLYSLFIIMFTAYLFLCLRLFLVMFTVYFLLCLQPIYCYVYSLFIVIFTVYLLLCLQSISCYVYSLFLVIIFLVMFTVFFCSGQSNMALAGQSQIFTPRPFLSKWVASKIWI